MGTAIPKKAFFVSEFYLTNEISRSMFYKLSKKGLAPHIMKVGRRTLISVESAEQWRRQNGTSRMSLSPGAIAAISKVIEGILQNAHYGIILPRRMNEKHAAAYVGRSFYWMRNLRKSDDERVANGGERRGPCYVREGKSPMYFREDLDVWLDNLKLIQDVQTDNTKL